MTVKAAFIQADTYSASDTRGAIAALAAKDDGGNVRDGVIQPQNGALEVTANSTPNMHVNVAAGSALASGYLVTSDATVDLTVAAASTSNARIDLVVAQVEDSEAGDSDDAASVSIITGTPGASPVAPSAPDRSIALAKIAVAQNATSIGAAAITDVRAATAADGGVIWTANATGRPDSPQVGQLVYRVDEERVEVWRPNGWTPFPGTELAYGENTTLTDISITNGNFIDFVTLTFTTDVPLIVELIGHAFVKPSIADDIVTVEAIIDNVIVGREDKSLTLTDSTFDRRNFRPVGRHSLAAGSHTARLSITRQRSGAGSPGRATVVISTGLNAFLWVRVVKGA